MSQHGTKRPENVALLSDILWPVGPHFVGLPFVRPNILIMPKSASSSIAVLLKDVFHGRPGALRQDGDRVCSEFGEMVCG